MADVFGISENRCISTASARPKRQDPFWDHSWTLPEAHQNRGIAGWQGGRRTRRHPKTKEVISAVNATAMILFKEGST